MMTKNNTNNNINSNNNDKNGNIPIDNLSQLNSILTVFAVYNACYIRQGQKKYSRNRDKLNWHIYERSEETRRFFSQLFCTLITLFDLGKIEIDECNGLQCLNNCSFFDFNYQQNITLSKNEASMHHLELDEQHKWYKISAPGGTLLSCSKYFIKNYPTFYTCLTNINNVCHLCNATFSQLNGDWQQMVILRIFVQKV